MCTKHTTNKSKQITKYDLHQHRKKFYTRSWADAGCKALSTPGLILKTAIKMLMPRFDPREQNDPAEFLQYLFTGLNKEVRVLLMQSSSLYDIFALSSLLLYLPFIAMIFSLYIRIGRLTIILQPSSNAMQKVFTYKICFQISGRMYGKYDASRPFLRSVQQQ